MADIANADEDIEVPQDPRLVSWKKDAYIGDTQYEAVDVGQLASRMSDLDVDMHVQLGDAFDDSQTRPYIMSMI